jgi:hypothetical protein
VILLGPLTRSAVAALALLALAAAGCPSNGDEQGPKPTTGAEGRERWIVTFDGSAPDLGEYRALQRDNPKAVDAYVGQMRDGVMRGRAEMESFLGSVEGRVVERWWMTNAVTVEVPAGAVETLKKQPGVKSVAPDLTLE